MIPQSVILSIVNMARVTGFVGRENSADKNRLILGRVFSVVCRLFYDNWRPTMKSVPHIVKNIGVILNEVTFTIINFVGIDAVDGSCAYVSPELVPLLQRVPENVQSGPDPTTVADTENNG